MIIGKTSVARLGFIKFLLNVAVEQSKKPEPFCSGSILGFHDAIELFFGLSCEHLGVTGLSDRTQFNEYWELIAGKLNGRRLSGEASIKRLNRARIGLKHQGIGPSKLNVEDFRVITRNFFEENTPIVFGIEFCDVSLIELVQYEKTKEYLKKAEEVMKQNGIEDALENVAYAFSQLVWDYESTKVREFGRSPLIFGKDMTFLSSFFWGFEELMADRRFKDKMREFVEGVKESVEGIGSAVKILSLGIDYRRYIKFRLLTPYVSMHQDGKWYAGRATGGSKVVATEEDVEFCINFVIESAIGIQELDFTLEGGR